MPISLSFTVKRLLARFREARNLGPAFHDRHPEQSDESTLCVEHNNMIALDLSARRDNRLSADSGVLEPHQVGFAGHFHLPNTSSANPKFPATWHLPKATCAAFSMGKPHGLPQRHQLRQEIRGN